MGFGAALAYTVYILIGDCVGAGVPRVALAAFVCLGATWQGRAGVRRARRPAARIRRRRLGSLGGRDRQREHGRYPVWASAPGAHPHPAGHQSSAAPASPLVEVRAVHDGDKVYFAFRWEDPTRSLRRLPMIKKEDGWHIIADNAYIDDVTTSTRTSSRSSSRRAGDSAAAALRISDRQAARRQAAARATGGAITTPTATWSTCGSGRPRAAACSADVDDMYIGPPRSRARTKQSHGNRYQAGYWGDPGDTPSTPTISSSTRRPNTKGSRSKSCDCRRTRRR